MFLCYEEHSIGDISFRTKNTSFCGIRCNILYRKNCALNWNPLIPYRHFGLFKSTTGLINYTASYVFIKYINGSNIYPRSIIDIETVLLGKYTYVM